MSASITDKITNTGNGTRPVSTTVQTLRSSGITTLACNDLTGWPTNTAVHFVTYKVDGQGKVVAGSQTDWKGIVSGTSISNLTVTGGTDNGNAVNDIVEILPTAAWGKDLTDALSTTLNQDGTIKSGVVTASTYASSSVPSSALNLSKTTDANGWTVYDFGTWKQYRKRGSTSLTAPGTTWAPITLSSTLPVGISTIGTNFVDATASTDDKVIRIQVEPQASASSITASYYNPISSTVPTNISWSVTITTA